MIESRSCTTVGENEELKNPKDQRKVTKLHGCRWQSQSLQEAARVKPQS